MSQLLYYSFRKFYNSSVLFIIGFLSFLAVLPFFFIIYFVFQRGFFVINWDFITQIPPAPGEQGGGVANALLGSLSMVGLATLCGIPWACLLGVSLSEYSSHFFSKVLRFVIDMSISTPSILLGIFVYSLLVIYFGFSAYAGAFALLLILIPIIARSTEEILQMVPNHIREAGLALGLPRWKVIMKILIPGTLTMLISGIILAIARISGETAPLLFTALGNPFFSKSLQDPTASLPVQIYNFAKSGFANMEDMAWGAALLLIVFIVLIHSSTKLIIFFISSQKTNRFKQA